MEISQTAFIMNNDISRLLDQWLPAILVMAGIVGFFIAIKLLKKAITCAIAILLVSIIAAGIYLLLG